MDSEITSVSRPVGLQIADAIRISIEQGELRPGDRVPSVHELTQRWHCAPGTARTAIGLLKQQGLIVSAGRGAPPTVKAKPRRVVRSSDRHQTEKDLVHEPLEVRASTGAAEMDMETNISDLDFHVEYKQVPANESLAGIFKLPPGETLLRRTYELIDPAAGRRQAWSVSHIPVLLIADNPDLLDSENEPWPGGTQHQLSTVGIEVLSIVDEVRSEMPTTVEQRAWGLHEGVPMLRVWRTSIDTEGRVVETSDADYPADRTELHFTTHLKKW